MMKFSLVCFKTQDSEFSEHQETFNEFSEAFSRGWDLKGSYYRIDISKITEDNHVLIKQFINGKEKV